MSMKMRWSVLSRDLEETPHDVDQLADLAWWWVTPLVWSREFNRWEWVGPVRFDDKDEARSAAETNDQAVDEGAVLVIGNSGDPGDDELVCALVTDAPDDVPAPSYDVLLQIRRLVRSDLARRRQESDGARAEFGRRESSDNPLAAPPVDVTQDHLYANKVGFPNCKTDAGTTTVVDGDELDQDQADTREREAAATSDREAEKGGES